MAGLSGRCRSVDHVCGVWSIFNPAAQFIIRTDYP